jgi:predicted nucleic acid-binding protein
VSYLVDADWLIDAAIGRPRAQRTPDRLSGEGLAVSIIAVAEIYEARVEDVVVGHEKLRMSRDEIVDAIPTITLADVHAALAYYWDNREDLDRQMEKNSAEADEYRRLIDDGRLARMLLQRLD